MHPFIWPPNSVPQPHSDAAVLKGAISKSFVTQYCIVPAERLECPHIMLHRPFAHPDPCSSGLPFYCSGRSRTTDFTFGPQLPREISRAPRYWRPKRSAKLTYICALRNSETYACHAPRKVNCNEGEIHHYNITQTAWKLFQFKYSIDVYCNYQAKYFFLWFSSRVCGRKLEKIGENMVAHWILVGFCGYSHRNLFFKTSACAVMVEGGKRQADKFARMNWNMKNVELWYKFVYENSLPSLVSVHLLSSFCKFANCTSA